MIKIANVIEEDRFVGPHKRIMNVGRHLEKHDIETIVYYPLTSDNHLADELKKMGVGFRRVRLTGLSRNTLQLCRYFFCFMIEILLLAILLKRDRIDIVHCNGCWQVKGVIAGKLARKTVVWHLNDTNRPFLIKSIFNLISPFLCDGFILAGESVKAYYINGNKSLEKKPHHIIPAPVSLSEFRPFSVTQKKVLSDHGLNIVTIANINPAKGLQDFLDMAYILTNTYKHVLFYIAGRINKSQETYYRNLLAQKERLHLTNVHFLGFRSDVVRILNEADIFVCTSHFEASPTTVWEAMAMELPVVSTRVGDVPFVIEEAANGFTVPPKAPDLLARKVSVLMENLQMSKQIGSAARATVSKKMGLTTVAALHETFYRKLVSKDSKVK